MHWVALSVFDWVDKSVDTLEFYSAAKKVCGLVERTVEHLAAERAWTLVVYWVDSLDPTRVVVMVVHLVETKAAAKVHRTAAGKAAQTVVQLVNRSAVQMAAW